MNRTHLNYTPTNMDQLLTKLRLVDTMTTELKTSKSEFVAKLKRCVDEDTSGLFSNLRDVFSSSENEFKGAVDLNGFKLKRKAKLFDANANSATARGRFREDRDTLVVTTQINGFSKAMIPFYILILLFYGVFFGIFTQDAGDNMPGFVLPFVVLHGLFMAGIPYLIMRRGVSKMKYELERELHYIAAKA